MDVAPQEERMVGGHMESCESCAKFHHQLQQVIMAAEEVPLPDDLAPPQPEALAHNIMEQLPQPKSGLIAMILELFKGKVGKSDAAPQQSRYPHRTKAGEEALEMPTKRKSDHSGTANRLKSIGKSFAPESGSFDTREAQSSTRSLGEKFGMAAPAGVSDEQPLTLAESIRRKVTETQRPQDDDSDGDNASPPQQSHSLEPIDDGWSKPSTMPMMPPANMASPPQIPGKPMMPDGPQPVVGSWGKPSPIDGTSWQSSEADAKKANGDWGFDTGSGPAATGDPFSAAKSGIAAPTAPGTQGWSSTNWNDSPPKGSTEPDSDWGPAPQGGVWDEPGSMPQPQTQSGQPAPTGAASWEQQGQPDATRFNQLQGNRQGETGFINIGALGLPSLPNQGGQAQAQSASNPGSNQTAPKPPGQNNAPGWGQQTPVQQTPAGQPPGGDPWTSSDSWNTGSLQSSWSPAPAPVTPDWGNTPPRPPVSQAAQPNPATASSQQPNDSWNTGSQAAWGTESGTRGWAPPAEPQQWNSQPVADWSASQGAAANQGGQSASQANAQRNAQKSAAPAGRPSYSIEAEQIETGTWRAFTPSGETLGAPAARPLEQPTVPSSNQSFSPPQDEQSRWDIPIQERMKAQNAANAAQQAQSFNPPGFAQSSANAQLNQAQSPQQPAAPYAQGNQAFQQPPANYAQPPVQEPPASTKSGWNFPVYETPPDAPAQPSTQPTGWDLGMGKLANPAPNPVAPPAPAPAPVSVPTMPAAAPAKAAVSGGLPVDSILDRLDGVLNERQAGTPNPQDQWEMSIQERQQQQQKAAWAQAQSQAQAPIAQQAPLAAQAPMQAQAPAQATVANSGTAPIMPGGNGWGNNQANMQSLAPQTQAPQQPAPRNPWDSGSSPQTGPGTGWGQTSQQVHAPQPAPIAYAAPAQPASTPPTPAKPAAPSSSGLFQNLDDKAIDKLFDENLGISSESSAAAHIGSTPGWANNSAPAARPNTPPNSIPPLPTPPASPFSQWTGQGQGQRQPETNPIAPPYPNQNNQPASSQFAPPSANDANGPKISAVTRNTGANTMPPAPTRGGSPFSAPNLVQAAHQASQQNMPAATSQPQFVSTTSKPSGLFNLDDSAMDELFMKNLGVTEGQPAATAAPPSMPAYQSPQAQAQNPFMNRGQATSAPTNPQSSSGGNPFAPLANQQQQLQSQTGGWSTERVYQQAQSQQIPPIQGQTRPVQQSGQHVASNQSAYNQQQPAQPNQQAAQQQGGPGLFSIDDSVIDRIFADNQNGGNASNPQPPKFHVNEAVREISQAATSAPLPPPKIEGIGKLDTNADTSADTGSGRIASIGKFLLDQKDLQTIGRLTEADLSDTKMRILTTEAAQELQNLLHHIGAQQTVVGSVIVGHDGLLIANTMPSDVDAESIGVWALAVYMATEMVIRKMGQDRVYQIVSKTVKGYVVIADFGGGLLVTVSDGKDTDALIPLMRSITQLVAQ